MGSGMNKQTATIALDDGEAIDMGDEGCVVLQREGEKVNSVLITWEDIAKLLGLREDRLRLGNV
jgi:hypothetical protein